MTISASLAEYRARRLLDSLFDANAARHGEICEWPVIGGYYVSGSDPIERERETAVRALLASDWFADHGPVDSPPLPLSHDEREALKVGGLKHLVAWYANSLECLDWKFWDHPSFDDYARGVMASDKTPYFIKEDKELQWRFPPRPLSGLGSGLCWTPPALN